MHTGTETGPELIGRCLGYLRIKIQARHVILINKTKEAIAYSLEQPLIRLELAMMEALISDLFKKQSDFKDASISSNGKTISIGEWSVKLPEEMSKHKKTAEKVLVIKLNDGNYLLVVNPKIDHNSIKEKIITTVTTLESAL